MYSMVSTVHGSALEYMENVFTIDIRGCGNDPTPAATGLVTYYLRTGETDRQISTDDREKWPF